MPRDDEKLTDTKRRIQTVARELFVQKGVRQTSLQDIANRLSITKPALYYHFSSRDELVRSIIDPLLDGGDAAVAELEAMPDPPPRLVLEGFFDFQFRYRDVMRMVLFDPALLGEPGLIDRAMAWRERLAVVLHGAEPTPRQRIRTTVALGGLADATVLHPDIPDAELRAAAVDSALAALGMPTIAVKD